MRAENLFDFAKEDLGEEWNFYLKEEFSKKYMQDLQVFLRQRQELGKIIYPKQQDIFTAFKQTPPSKIKAIILGQDPYHGENQADGLCFSVAEGEKIPPSLRNIFKELTTDLDILTSTNNGCLLNWAKQGVFLLNTSLTVEAGDAGSHQGKGWETFTDRVLSVISKNCQASSFILWGNFAIKKQDLIDASKHQILTAPHPSPLSANKGFFGTKPFSKTNEFLTNQNREPINWKLTNSLF